MRKIFFKVGRDLYPQIKDRFPYIYLEHGRLEVDDSSVKWISSENEVIRLPVAVLNAILLGPGTSITHEAIHSISSANCLLCWVGEQSLKFYAVGMPPTADTQNLYKQIRMSANPESRLLVARRMFAKRFPGVDLSDKNLQALMGMEGQRVRAMYFQMAQHYGIEWHGRSYTPGQPERSDMVNKILTFTNSLLYGVITSLCFACGYSPRIGFVHSGSPMPFIYDMADIYKQSITIDLAFKTAGESSSFDRKKIIEEVASRIIESDMLGKFASTINWFLDEDSKCWC